MKVELIKRALKGSKLKNKMTNLVGRNREAKNSITQGKNTELSSRATNGGLKKQTHRGSAKAELATAKRHNQEERSRRGRT